MRKMVLSLMSVTALALTGCNAPAPSPTDSGAPASTKSVAATNIPSEVSGTIALREPGQLSANARMVINLVDVSSGAAAGNAPLVSKTVAPVGQFPQPFQLSFNPAEVKPADIYVVQVLLTDGERKYSMPIQAPVLTKGSKSVVAIDLVSEHTPGEKVLAAFTTKQKLLGGMKVSNGTKLEKDDSRGWQLFREAGQVEFIRELVDYGAKGFTSTDYAYRDGKPWAIVQETKASKDAKPSSIDRAGWDESGLLVLKQHQAGGNVQTLDAEAVAKLQKQALEILGMATGGKNK
jgi:putative lipoprotein